MGVVPRPCVYSCTDSGLRSKGPGFEPDRWLCGCSKEKANSIKLHPKKMFLATFSEKKLQNFSEKLQNFSEKLPNVIDKLTFYSNFSQKNRKFTSKSKKVP